MHYHQAQSHNSNSLTQIKEGLKVRLEVRGKYLILKKLNSLGLSGCLSGCQIAACSAAGFHNKTALTMAGAHSLQSVEIRSGSEQ